MKLPNGFGSIVEYRDKKRRKPFIVKKSINGKQKVIGNFITYEDALTYLIDYNKDPQLYSPSTVTFDEIYQLMTKDRYPKLSKSAIANYELAYRRCKHLWNKEFKKLKIHDFQNVIQKMSKDGIGHASQKKTRQLFHSMYKCAIKYQLISPNADISAFIDIDKKETVHPKKPFNTRQINRIKQVADSNHPLAMWASTILMMIYSGPRTSEFLQVLKKDVHLSKRYYVIRESKTEAGRNRIVPINKKVLEYYERWMELPGKNLITDCGKEIDYHKYRLYFDQVMELSRCKHTPHECRHTCATLLDNANANETAVKRILGHASNDITKQVYTHKNLHELKKAIDLI